MRFLVSYRYVEGVADDVYNIGKYKGLQIYQNIPELFEFVKKKT